MNASQFTLKYIKQKGYDMEYSLLKMFFKDFHIGLLTKTELICAIGLWQQTLNYTEV